MTWEINRLNKRLNLESKILEKVYTIIGKIDTVKINFSLTTNLLPQTIHRLTSSLVVTSTGASLPINSPFFQLIINSVPA